MLLAALVLLLAIVAFVIGFSVKALFIVAVVLLLGALFFGYRDRAYFTRRRR